MYTSKIIIRPTISSMIKELEELVANGWHKDQQIQVTQMMNAPEVFSIMAVEVWKSGLESECAGCNAESGEPCREWCLSTVTTDNLYM